ncbi:MAG: MBOAT family protein [Clostridia bacterium]|nr:MBOAT family protein [Clostridia bacterium]
MVFSSFTFLLLFMPCVILLYWIMPAKARIPFLFAASLLFYGWGNPAWLLLLGYSLLLNWGGAQLMMRTGKHRKAVFVILIILNLLPLAVFKYAGLLRDTWNGLLPWKLRFDDLPLPAGISFFTFQAMSYLFDVYRGEARLQKNFMTFGAYVTLFPQLVAGPIVRYIDLEQQLIDHPKPTAGEMRTGLQRFAVGLCKKVLLADAMGRLWSQMNGDFAQAGALGAWIGLLAFSFQIFFDFSGYSDMAIGLGHMMGFTMPENFDRPYRARSLTDFWRRWHMTLTDWFKAYVYIPLGGSRVGKVRRDINLLIVWALTGLWHGAGWNFVLWGLYFAVLLMLEKRFLLKNERWEAVPGALRQGFTFLLVMFGWALFSGFGGELVSAMVGVHGFATAESLTACAAFAPLLLVCGAISFLPAPKNFPLKRFATPLLILLCLAALAAQGYAPFVYFQF